jgi:hypothetical protein
MNFNEAKIINVYYTKGDRKPYDINGKPIAYIGEEFVGATGATTLRFHFGEDLDSSTATIVTKRGDGERRLDVLTKVTNGETSYYQVTLNEWYGAVKGKAVVALRVYNGEVTFDDNENPTEITSVSGRIVVSDIFNLDIAYAPVADLVVPPDASEPYEEFFFALSTKLDKADSITVAGALPTLTGDVYDDRYFYVQNEGVGRLYYINGSVAEEVVFQLGTLKLTSNGNEDINVGTNAGKLYWDEERGTIIAGLYDDQQVGIGDGLFFFGKATENILKGEVVQFAGNTGGNIRVKKAVFSEISAQPDLLMGVAKHNINTNDFGYVVSFGYVRDLNTSAFPTPILYLSTSVDGALSSTKPTTGFKGSICAVARPSTGGGSNGFIIVRPNLVKGIGDLSNVTITSVANGNVLSYDGSKWVNSTRLSTAEGEIDDIEDGTTIVGKANADKDGNEFDATYLKKTSASSIYVPLSQKGAVNGVATLGSDGRVVPSQLPASIGEILEYDTLEDFPEEGTSERIYIAKDTNITYRWSGTQYVEISASLALGETSSTAFAGNRGVALETLTDDIVDGTQTLTDTRITNSAVGTSPLIVDSIASTTATLQEWKVNNSARAYITSSGAVRTLELANLTTNNNSRLQLANEGTTISRNINDTNVALVVRKNQGTGNILELQTGTSDKKLEVDVNGWFYQNGTRLFTQPVGVNNTFFGFDSGGSATTGERNTAFGNRALNALTSGLENTAFGRLSLFSLTTGSENVAIGESSGRTIITGSNNTFLGDNAGFNASQLATASNSTGIGFGSFTDKSNQMVFGNASVTEFKFDRNASAIALLPNASLSGLLSIGTATPLTTGGTHLLTLQTSGVAGIILGASNNDNIYIRRSGVGTYQLQTTSGGTNSGQLSLQPFGGNVGIGTGSPARLLSLVTSSNADGLQIRRNSITDNDYALLGFRIATSDADNNLAEIRGVRTNRGVSADTDLVFITRGNNSLTEKMRIRDDGLVGINETSPSAQLQVKSGATNRIALIVDTLASHTENLQQWRVNGSFRASVTTDGRFLTGDGIANSATASNSRIITATTGTTISRNVADSNPALIVNLANASASGNIQVWQKAGTARAYITNTGGAVFGSAVTMENDAPGNINLSVIANPTQTADLQYWEGVGGVVAYVTKDTDFYNENGVYGTASDIRIKENVETARSYTDDLMKLRVVKYSLKQEQSDKPTHLGFIAQEVEEVFPNMVATSKRDEIEDFKSIKMSVLIPMLVKTIQEQEKRIKELEAKL